MGCFLGCFGDAKDRRCLKPRIQRPDSQVQQKKVRSLQQQSVLLTDQSIAETQPPNLVSELRDLSEGEGQLSPSLSPRKRVTFNSNITTYEHYSCYESTDSLPEGNPNVQKSSTLEEYSVKSSVVSYPSNHRYHNARDSDDEAEYYSDSDLDDLEDDYEDEDDMDFTSDGREVWSVSTLTPSLELTENQSASAIRKTRLLDDDETRRSKSQARNRSDYVNSVLTPVENVTQWKAAKCEGRYLLKSQKENNQSLYSPPVSCDRFENSDQEIAVDASLSNWLVSSESTHHIKTNSSGIEEYIKGVKAMSKG